MPFIPHTESEIKSMLDAIGVEKVADLFDEIPKSIPKADISSLPEGLAEKDLVRLMMDRAPLYKPGMNFVGAGAYEHHIPAAVWDVTTRGEFYTAYTPYQAEVSQGTLQVIYEYQSMMAALMDMEVSNASMYDGATALAESILMALRLKREKLHRVLVPQNLHPNYRKVLQVILKRHQIDMVEWAFDAHSGLLDVEMLKNLPENEFAAVVVSQPNFFGGVEEIDLITNLAHAKGALLIACVNPMAMALLKAPGSWGEQGADIVCGEGQPLGVPLAGGGPYLGFMCCRKKDVRQMPGRIVGRTTDDNGHVGYVLTLQAREQHIRRAKATSNICTNQGLLVTAATIYMSIVGPHGLHEAAVACHQNALRLKRLLAAIDGVDAVFEGPFFHEFVIRTQRPLSDVQAALLEKGLQAGLALEPYYPELKNCLLVCATETKTEADLEQYRAWLLASLEG